MTLYMVNLGVIVNIQIREMVKGILEYREALPIITCPKF